MQTKRLQEMQCCPGNLDDGLPGGLRKKMFSTFHSQCPLVPEIVMATIRYADKEHLSSLYAIHCAVR